MVQFNFSYDPNISLEQRVGFELAAMIWSSYLTDDVTVNLHIASSDSLGEEGSAVGGAIPILHEQNYGVYQAYAEADASSDSDAQAIDSLQTGNTVDLLVDDQVVDGNTDILLTSAQAKALGMHEALTLDNGHTWDRDLVDPNGLDGYILVSNAYDWNYDYTRSGAAPEGTLDFISMALHEIGHQLGFISSLDGTLDVNTLYSGDTQAAGFTVLDLFRHSVESSDIDNPDGTVNDLTLGQNSYFSIDGGQTNLGDFADGVDYQASHWKRLQVAMGIMDPTLAYTERLTLGHLDLQALDVLGWDINPNALDAGLDIEALLVLAENKVEASLGLSETALNESRGAGQHGDMYSLGYNQWWQIFEQHVMDLGYSQWWQIFELGYDQWQQQEGGTLEVGYSQWWQSFEDTIIDLGYSQWWQSFEADMLDLGYSQWWQLLEVGYSQWWQKLETYFSQLDTVNGNVTEDNAQVADGGVGGQETKIFYGGENDDIIAGDEKQDRIKAGDGDDLIDGKEGHDVIWGEAGRDIIYGQDGNDLLYGGEDDDLLLGEAGDDDLRGEAGDDIASGGSGDDIVRGGDGKDDLKGGWGRDVLSGDAGDDRLEGEDDNDIVIGGQGRDQVNGGGGNDILYGDDYVGTESLRQLRKQLQQQSEDNTSTSAASSSTGGIYPIRVEVENMLLTGDYKIQDWSSASENIFIVNTSAEATSTFSGPSGRYMVVARYYDRKNNSNGVIDFSFNGTLVNSFALDKETNRFHTQTIVSDIALSEGDEFSISVPDVGGEQEIAIDYLEFVSLDNLLVTPLGPEEESSTTSNSFNSTSENSTSSEGEDVFRVEAETMTLLGDYVVESNSTSSGSALIGAQKRGEGIALTTFGGDAGYYNIVVGYYDENDTRIGQISAALNSETLDIWSLDQNLGDTFASSQNFLTRTVASTVLLNTGDVFKLTSLAGVNGPTVEEHAYIDYVDFVKVSAPTITQANLSTQGGISTDFIDESLVAHWNFDETSGLGVNDATGRQQAILVNTATDNTQWGEGQLGGALHLDGVNDYVAVADSSDINLSIHGQRTVSIWFKADDTAVANRKQVIYEEGGGTNGLNLYIHDGKLYAGGWNRGNNQSGWTGTYLQTDEIVSGQWHHVSVVLDGNEQVQAGAFSAYLDGERFGVGEGSQLWKHGGNIGLGAIDNHTRFHDGTNGATGSNALAGSLDDARIYNRALNKEEILSMVGRDNDRLQGGAGNDTIYGGQGDDTLYGESLGDTSSSLLRGAQTYNGNTYLVSQLGTWEDSQAEAQRLGGNLVTINDASEQNWLARTFDAQWGYWIGITDRTVEGQWEWASGEAVNYTNWIPGEPNNSGGAENYGEMLSRSSDQPGKWNDSPIAAEKYGIIEINAANNDTLFGDSGNDSIFGQAGNDALYGDTLATALSEGLVLHWSFDEGAGNGTAETAGKTNDIGQLWGNATWTDGKLGSAVELDGYNSGISAIDSAELDITHQLTLSAWVRADQFSQWAGIITKGTVTSPYTLMIMDDGALQFESNYGQSDWGEWKSNAQLTANQWHHVAATYDGEALRFYIDGQLDSNVVYTDIDFATNDEDLVVGAQLPGGDEYFDGAIDDVRVYNRALSAVELAALATVDNHQTEAMPQFMNLVDDGNDNLALYEETLSINGTFNTSLVNADTGFNNSTVGIATADGKLFYQLLNYSLAGRNTLYEVTMDEEGVFHWTELSFNSNLSYTLGLATADGQTFYQLADDGVGTAALYEATLNADGTFNRTLLNADSNISRGALSLSTVDGKTFYHLQDDGSGSASLWQSTLQSNGTFFNVLLSDDSNISHSALGQVAWTPNAQLNESNDDHMIGGGGNDTMLGGIGDDTLDGSDAIAAGYFERDILGGGLGADTFVVGSASQAYYIGGGDQDYALIKDFNANEDTVQLHGSADNYQQQQQSSDVYLSYGSELIAIFENTTTLDFNSASVSYV